MPWPPPPHLLALRSCLLAALLLLGLAADPAAAEPARPTLRRIVSINPSLTSILVALGARDTLVGVDDYSARQSPEVADLPRVGGLFSPSLEAVVALRPDAVVLVPSAEQRDFRDRVEALGIRVHVFQNIHFDEVLENIRRLGELVGREPAARERVAAIERTRAAVARAAAGRPAPRVLLVLQRDPIYVAGRGSFIDEMIETLGARNLGAEFDDPYPRVASEWVVAQGPDVLIDLSPDRGGALAYWSRWPSIPAVANGRMLELDAEQISMPGPYLDRSLEVLAGGLYGEDFANELRRGGGR
jgi:ABC-type Fe3+-hydroxamate transport system substrate-binding protein